MLVSVLPVPFADAGRQRQYDAVLAALHAAADAPATVLLGNLGAFAPYEADILLVQPSGLTLLVLAPHAGHLTLPAQVDGSWQLDGQPLPGYEVGDIANPLAQYQQQLPRVLNWLSEQFGLAEDESLPSTGMALFDAPLTFGPAVEAQLHRHAATHDFQLVGDAAQLPARLRQARAAESAMLDADELLDWGEYLADEPYAAHEEGTPESPLAGLPAYLEQKLRQLWRWLGAEDIPADIPYGGGPPDQHLRDQQEQARLQQLRHELQAELHQQRQEATTREAARTQELAQLRQQLAQAGLSATERQAEQQATAKLESELRTTRAELAARNHELDTRIRQLGLLIKHLQTTGKPAEILAPAPTTQPATTIATQQPTGQAVARPAMRVRPTSFRRLRQAERWGIVALVVAGLGAGTWGVVRLAHPAKPRATTAAAPRRRPIVQEEGSTPNVVYVVDSTLAPTQPDTSDAHLYSVDKEPAPAAPPAAPAQPPVDSVATPAAATPTPVDSAAAPSPAP